MNLMTEIFIMSGIYSTTEFSPDISVWAGNDSETEPEIYDLKL